MVRQSLVHYWNRSRPYLSKAHPTVISTAEVVNINGHKRKGRKLILNPVNIETIAKTTKNPDEVMYTPVETGLLGSMAVTRATKTLVKIKAMPSIIHSIAIIFRLSKLIFPNPLIIDFVGKR